MDNGFQDGMEAESEFAIVDVYQDYIEIKGYTLTSGDPTLHTPVYKQLPIATYLLKTNGNGGGGSTGNVSVTYDASGSTIYKAARGWLQRRDNGARADNPTTGVQYDIVVQLTKDNANWSTKVGTLAISKSMAKDGVTIGGEGGGDPNGVLSYCSYTFTSKGSYTITLRNKENDSDRVYVTFTIII